MGKSRKKNNAFDTEGMNIRTKLLVTIVPIIVVLIAVMTIVTTMVSQNIIMSRSSAQMEATLGEYANDIAKDLEVIRAQANELSLFIAATHDTVSIQEYQNSLCAVIVNSDMILGSGIWLEPNVYDKAEKYYGPYWYKNVVDGKWDGQDLIETWDYSNADYDYFNQEYYQNAKNLPEATITDPYYDETSGLVMATCSAPIRDREGTFLGCVTVDLMLTTVNDKLSVIKVGDTGTVWMIDSAGNYIYHPAFENVAQEGMNIQTSTEMGEYVAKIMSQGEGEGKFKYEGQTRLLYWAPVPGQGWKMGLTITQAELFSAVQQLLYISIIICIIAIVGCTAVIFVQANGISKAVSVIAKALESLSEGKFERISSEHHYKDEFGIMIESTNTLIDKLTGIVQNIKEHAEGVAASSGELSDMTEQISATTDDVSNAVQEIASGATQQADEIQTAVNATDTVSNAVNGIKETSMEISQSAKEMSDASKATSDAIDILQVSSEKTSSEIEDISAAINATKEAVEAIRDKVEGITNIATQTNLLSLNASIEAARAGEAGKGFSVVAEEIGKLASDSKQMADSIKAEMQSLLEKSDVAVKSVKNVKESNEETQEALQNSLESVGKMIAEIDKTVRGIEDISSGTDSSIEAKNAVVDTMSALSAISEENAASAEETGASMEELNATITTLNEAAGNLSNIAEELNKEMEFFKI